MKNNMGIFTVFFLAIICSAFVLAEGDGSINSGPDVLRTLTDAVLNGSNTTIPENVSLDGAVEFVTSVINNQTDDDNKTGNETDDDLEDEIEDETDDEDVEETDDEDEEDDDETESDDNEIRDGSKCVISPELYDTLMQLQNRLSEANALGRDVSTLEGQINDLNQRIRNQKRLCVASYARSGEIRTNASENGVSVGRTCDLSSELKDKLLDAKSDYKEAIEDKDFEEVQELRAKIGKLEDEARLERLACMQSIVPGLIRQSLKNCTIPSELYDKLEKARYARSELKSLNKSIPAELNKEISDLGFKIAAYKARCNALNVSSDVEESDVARYYRQRMIEAMENKDLDSRVTELAELKQEIDETIKNILKEKRTLKFQEMDGLAEKIEFKKGRVKVGDSELNDTEVEVEIEDESDSEKNGSVKIKATKLNVVLSQHGYNVTSDDITVNESGIFVKDVLVKTLPASVYENNKNLQRNAERVIGLRLDKEGEKAVYMADYKIKKKILGIIPAEARHQLKIDAEDGETMHEKKPWWTVISTTPDADSETQEN